MNKACVRQVNGKTIRPFQVKSVTKGGACPINYTPFYPEIGLKGHNGEDWKVWNGEPLFFPVDIPDTEWWSRSEKDIDGGIGLDVFSSKRVKLETLPPQTGKLARKEWETNEGWVYIKFRFWHLKNVIVPDAQRPSPEEPRKSPNVKFGQLIAECDSTGASSGHHLHWTMKIVANNSMTLDANNGYYGGLDFEKWFENEFVLDKLTVTPPPKTTLQKLHATLFELERVLRSILEVLNKK
jgi:hypothetical protein